MIYALGIGAVLFLMLGFGGAAFGVDSREGWSGEPTDGINTTRRGLR